MIKRTIFLVLLSAILIGCATLRAEPTVSQQFRKVLADIDALCKKEKLGPYLDPSDPEYKDKRKQQGTCDILTLKPYDPLATPEGRFAHSLKLPSPHDQPKNVWRDGMTGEEYFKALCEAEVGEWVFRTVEGVKGIMLLRSRPDENNISMLGEYYVDAESAAVDYAIAGKGAEGYLVKTDRYEFLEKPTAGNDDKGKYIRFFRDSAQPLDREPYGVGHLTTKERLSRYGYTWRGIKRKSAREHGIFGAEIIVLDLQTQEILGFRRVFHRVYFDKQYADKRMMWPMPCPGDNTAINRGVVFLQQVLVPASKTGGQ